MAKCTCKYEYVGKCGGWGPTTRFSTDPVIFEYKHEDAKGMSCKELKPFAKKAIEEQLDMDWNVSANLGCKPKVSKFKPLTKYCAI